jgi:hypothetical protein
MIKKNKSNNDPIVSKGLFRTRTYTSEPDGTYKDVVTNRKGKVKKETTGVYKETDSETINKGSTTRYNKKGDVKSKKYFDRSTSNINSPTKSLMFPGMKKGGPITALDKVDKMYKAKYKKK